MSVHGDPIPNGELPPNWKKWQIDPEIKNSYGIQIKGFGSSQGDDWVSFDFVDLVDRGPIPNEPGIKEYLNSLSEPITRQSVDYIFDKDGNITDYRTNRFDSVNMRVNGVIYAVRKHSDILQVAFPPLKLPERSGLNTPKIEYQQGKFHLFYGHGPLYEDPYNPEKYVMGPDFYIRDKDMWGPTFPQEPSDFEIGMLGRGDPMPWKLIHHENKPENGGNIFFRDQQKVEVSWDIRDQDVGIDGTKVIKTLFIEETCTDPENPEVNNLVKVYSAALVPDMTRVIECAYGPATAKKASKFGDLPYTIFPWKDIQKIAGVHAGFYKKTNND